MGGRFGVVSKDDCASDLFYGTDYLSHLGTQLKYTVRRLVDYGARAVHTRQACPPPVLGCKFLNFSLSKSDLGLAARRDQGDGILGVPPVGEVSGSQFGQLPGHG
jgi:hypothetical protein